MYPATVHAGRLLPFLFILLWAPTLTPLHRVYGFGQHTAIVGVIEGLALFAGAALILRASRRRTAPAFAVLVAIAASWIAMTALTADVEPSRERTAAARHAAPSPSSILQTEKPRRALLLAIDGLDWNALDQLIAHGSLPFLSQLISHARTYEVDNHGLALSPAIWARAYTGNAHEPIQGFVRWSPRGTEKDIAVLPLWRHRPLFMLDRVLTVGSALHFWDTVSTSNADFVHPPLWRVTAGRARVGVFDPLPFDVLGERVNGFFMWEADDGFRMASSNGTGRPSIEVIPDNTSSTSMDNVIRSEAVRAGIAARAFARERPDIGIYYTHVLDAVGHMIWEPAAAQDVAEARAERRRSLTEGRIAAAYRAVDDALKTLTESFGSPATVLVVSDHGWEFNVYAHRTAPLGAAIVAGAGTTGYGGLIPVESVAATVLAVAQVPVPTTMADPIREIAPQWTTCTDCAAAPATFLSSPSVDSQRRDRLRSLGYVTK